MTATLRCEDIGAAFAGFLTCENTPEGLRYLTHCLYPSFEPVAVYVTRSAQGFVVHDGGGAARVAWLHGRDQGVVNKALQYEAAMHHLTQESDRLSVRVDSDEWLAQAMMAVANASASAARSAAEASPQAIERTLHEVIKRALRDVVRPELIAENGIDLRGKSGKTHHFDLAVRQKSGLTLIDSVAPHHVSIAAKYVAFSDTSDLDADIRGRFLVYHKALNVDDIALLTQCATVVPADVLKPKLAQHFA